MTSPDGRRQLPARPPLPAELGWQSTIMAEPLKNSFGPDVPARIARMIKEVDSTFNDDAFLTDALAGYEELELTPRASQLAPRLAVTCRRTTSGRSRR